MELKKVDAVAVSRWTAVAIFAYLCIACALGHYGKILPDAAADGAFASFQMETGVNYYYSGPDAAPNAVVGLQRQYTIQPDFWKPITDGKIFAEIIKGMQAKAQSVSLGSRPRGFVLHDNQGNTIGTWYSLMKGTTFVKMGGNNEVTIGLPELLLYEREESDHVGLRRLP